MSDNLDACLITPKQEENTVTVNFLNYIPSNVEKTTIKNLNFWFFIENYVL